MKKQAYKLVIITLLSLLPFAVQAQRFEWVRTYTGPEVSGTDNSTNRIIGSCVDSAGNLYILGEFSPLASLCGVDLVPHSIITTPIRTAVVIAKLSPCGELLWHKAIYTPAKNSYAYDMRIIGDTAFMVMVGFKMNHNFNGFLYYLDTLLTSADAGYLQSADSTHSLLTNAFITFDIYGNVTEQHFLELGYVDSTGHTITWHDRDPSQADNAMASGQLQAKYFNVDRDGYIYICRNTADYLSVYCDTCYGNSRLLSIGDGTIAAMRIMIDGIYPILYYPSHQSSTWNQQLLKFSSHFDSLIAAIYVFDSTDGAIDNTYIAPHSFVIDDRNIYIGMSGNILPSILHIANADSLQINTQIGGWPTWIIKFSTELQATGLIQLSSTSDFSVTLRVLSTFVDEATNSLFFGGGTKWASWYPSTTNMIFQGDTIEVSNRTGFWIRADKDNLTMLSNWVAQPIDSGEVYAPELSTYNNKVFAQTFFWKGIHFADTSIYSPATCYNDLAFMVWDYDGQELMINNRGVCHPDNTADKPIIVDSIVYLTGSLYDNASFGELSTSPTGNNSYAYIAKYVDPAFMVPYGSENQLIEWEQELTFSLQDSPVTLTATSTSGLPVSYSCSDTSVALVDGSTLYLLAEGEAAVTASQAGDGHYLPATPVTKTLHVGSTGIGHADMTGFVVYPNPARDAVYYHYANGKVKEIKAFSSTGLVFNVPCTGNKVDISHIPAGVYYLSFITENNIYQHKIIKL